MLEIKVFIIKLLGKIIFFRKFIKDWFIFLNLYDFNNVRYSGILLI